MILSLISLVSPQMVLARDFDAGLYSDAIYRAFAALFLGEMVSRMEDSQPTRCGHTVVFPCRGWRGALRPFEPCLQARSFARIPRQAAQSVSVMCVETHFLTLCLPSLSANKNPRLANRKGR